MTGRTIVSPTRGRLFQATLGRTNFTMRQLMNWLELPVEQRTRAVETRIGEILHEFGFTRHRRSTGRRGYYYLQPDERRQSSNLVQPSAIRLDGASL